MAHNKAAHKYFFKAFYGQTNKKEYELQILKHNIRHTNVIAMQNTILITKVPVESAKKKSLLLTRLIQRLREYTIQQIYYWSIIDIWILRTMKQLWI